MRDKHIIRRRTPSVSTYQNHCFDPDILPAYPEVYDEAEFSSKLQEECNEEAGCNKKVICFYKWGFLLSLTIKPHIV